MLSRERNFIVGLACLVYILLTTVFFITLQTSTKYKETLYSPSHADHLVDTTLHELGDAQSARNFIFVSESLRALRIQVKDKSFGESLMRSEHLYRLLDLLKYRNRWPTYIRISSLSVILDAVRDNRKAARQAIKSSLVDDLIVLYLSNEAYMLKADQRTAVSLQGNQFHRSLTLGIFAVIPAALILDILLAVSRKCPYEMTNVMTANIGHFVGNITTIIRETSSETSFILNHPRIRWHMGRLVDQSLLLLEMLPSHERILYYAHKTISSEADHRNLPYSRTSLRK